MPYNVEKKGAQFCVVKSDNGKQVACHPNRPKAIAQMRALYAQEGVSDAQVMPEVELLRLAVEGETPIHKVVQETMTAAEAVWTDNAEGLPQADVVIIRPGESANRRMYSKEAIAEAVRNGFWDGTPMFVDHGDPKMPRKRKLLDLKGRLDSTYLGQEGEARGKVTFLDPAFATFARGAQKNMGLSAVHEFMGQRLRGKDGHYHERVDRFAVNHSVDFVAFPAAGGEIAQFLPASESEDDVDWNSPLLTKEALLEHRPELVAEIKALAAESDEPPPEPDPKPEPEPEPVPTGIIAMEQVRSYVDERIDAVHAAYAERDRKIAATKLQIGAHVAKSGLNGKTISRLMSGFEGAEEYDSEAVQEAIDAAAEELTEAKATGYRGPKVTGLGDSTAQEADDKGNDPATLAAAGYRFPAIEEQMAFTPRSGKRPDDTGKAN